jgi:hypothetical protein
MDVQVRACWARAAHCAGGGSNGADLAAGLVNRRGGLRCSPQRHGAAGNMRRSGPVGGCPYKNADRLRSRSQRAGRRGAVRPGAARWAAPAFSCSWERPSIVGGREVH